MKYTFVTTALFVAGILTVACGAQPGTSTETSQDPAADEQAVTPDDTCPISSEEVEALIRAGKPLPDGNCSACVIFCTDPTPGGSTCTQMASKCGKNTQPQCNCQGGKNNNLANCFCK